MNNIIRSFDDDIVERVKSDFGFLVERVNIEDGELDLRLRNNYFNLYYKGNSLAKVDVKHSSYLIEINKAFVEATKDHPSEAINSSRFVRSQERDAYWGYLVERKDLHAFLSKEVITRLYRRIKDRSFSEELVFEQLLIADNRNRADFIVIDRQVQGGALGRTRIDLLGLRHTGEANKYNFEIVEAKMGNNPELRRDVADQLQGYVQIMHEHFGNFQQCYQRTYRQMKRLGLLEKPEYEEIEIVEPVLGRILVAGYPGLARKAQRDLTQYHQGLTIQTISYKLE